MLSNSRIYIFGVIYRGETWLSSLNCNALAAMISDIIKANIKNLSFKNIVIINVYKDDSYACEIHIEKLKYDDLRVLDKDQVKKLRFDLMNQLTKINGFTYSEIHVVNDEFSKMSSPAFLT